MRMLRLLIIVAVFLLYFWMASSTAWAIAGRDRVVAKDQAATELPGWPRGVLKLINHPLRANGWHSWFSECPNDGYYYEMEVQGPEDVNQLVKRLGEIESETLQVNLDPADGAAHGNGVGAIFALGNQPLIDQWFSRLPEVLPGIREFGVNRYRKPPTAQPPTLTLYLGHRAVDLEPLKIPVNVDVTTSTSEFYRNKHPEIFRRIDEFIARHKQKQEQAQQTPIGDD